jgi:hypothetical protein
MPESTIEEITANIIEQLRDFERQEFGNRLSHFAMATLRYVIQEELNKLNEGTE